MMFKYIFDYDGVETDKIMTKGLELFKGSVEFKEKKLVKKGSYEIFGLKINGYEIHNGSTKEIYKQKRNFYGTFIHRLFDNDRFRYKIFSKLDAKYKGYNFKKYKKRTIEDFASHIDKHIDMAYILERLH